MEEEKGFVIKDRRAFDEKGELKKEAAPKEEARKEEQPKREAGKEAPKEERPPLPEANFNSLIFSLSSTALLHLGEVPDPTSGEKKVDLPLAKHAIDTIHMLKEKTRGNLNEDEKKFIDAVLTDLKWRYVKAAK